MSIRREQLFPPHRRRSNYQKEMPVIRHSAKLLLLLLLVACSKDLTRSRVATLVKESADFAAPVTSLPLQDDGIVRGRYDAGEIEGLWTKRMSNDFYNRYTLTPKGYETFARDFSAREEAPLAQQSSRELLEVTGITTPPIGGESLRIATFTWRYAGLSEVAARYTGETSVIHKGEAVFQLFDDGWRLQQLELHSHADRVPFQWPAAVEEELQRQLEANRFTQEQALQLAKASFLAREPVLNFNIHPAWNIPDRHGLTGQPLNADKMSKFLDVLKRYGVVVVDAKPSGGYFRVSELTPPDTWSDFARPARFSGGRTYAVFKTADVKLTDFSYTGGDSDNASATVQVTYADYTTPSLLAGELEELPVFDYGGKPMEKAFINGRADWGATRQVVLTPGQPGVFMDSGTVHFSRGQDGTWKVASIR